MIVSRLTVGLIIIGRRERIAVFVLGRFGRIAVLVRLIIMARRTLTIGLIIFGLIVV